jgi:hypothetical protein
VDEVSLTFHAADAHGLPVNDLKLDELRVLDNGRSPRRIVAFHSLREAGSARQEWVGLMLLSGKIQHDHIGMLLHSFENHLMAIRRDVEVANVEV